MINKKFFSIGLIVIMLFEIMFILTGCGKPKFSVDDCLKYMNEKYGEEFDYISLTNEYQTNSSLKIFVKSKKYPNNKILVVEELTSDGIKYHDTYVRAKYKQDTYNLMNSIATDVYGECRVIDITSDDIYFLPDSFNNTTTFAEYISNIKSNISFSVLLPKEHSKIDKENEINRFYESLRENNIICSCSIYYTNDEEKYEKINSLQDIATSENWYSDSALLNIGEDYSKEVWLNRDKIIL